MSNVLENFLIRLGVDYDKGKLTEFNKSMEKSSKKVKEFSKTLAASAAAFTFATFKVTQHVDALAKLGRETGVGTNELYGLNFALKRVGAQSDDIGASFSSLAKLISEASRGVGSGVEIFGLLGLSAVDASGNLKTAKDLFLEVADSVQGLDIQRQAEFAEKLGLGSSLRLLQAGRTEINKLINESERYGTITAKQAKFAEEFQDSWTNVSRVFSDINRRVFTHFGKSLKSIIDTFTNFYAVNKDIISQKLTEWMEKAGDAAKVLTASLGVMAGGFVVSKISKLILSFGSMFKVLRGISALLTMINVKILLFPAAIGAFVLLLEDAYRWSQGSNSMFGEWISKFPKIEGALRLIANILALGGKSIAKSAEGWRLIGDLAGTAFEKLSKSFNELWNGPVLTGIRDMISSIVDKIDEFAGAIANLIENFTSLNPINAISGLFGDDEEDSQDGKPKAGFFKRLTGKSLEENAEQAGFMNTLRKNGIEENDPQFKLYRKLLNDGHSQSSDNPAFRSLENSLRQRAAQNVTNNNVSNANTSVENNSNASNKSVSQSNNITINVKGSSDARGTAIEIERILQQATQDLSTSVER